MKKRTIKRTAKIKEEIIVELPEKNKKKTAETKKPNKNVKDQTKNTAKETIKKGKALVEKKKQKQKKRGFLFLFLSFLGILASGIGIFLAVPELRIRGYLEEIEVEFGEGKLGKEIGKMCFGNIFMCKDVEVEILGDEVNLEKVGEYHREYKILLENGKEREFSQTITVSDHNAPEIWVQEEEIAVCPNGKIPEFDIKVKDNYDGEIVEGIEKEFREGEVVILAKDSNGNVTERRIMATVEDKVAPEINLNGEERYVMTVDQVFEVPEPTVEDNCDEVQLFSEGDVNYKKIGEYKIRYYSGDESGNKAEKVRTVIIKEMPERGVIYLTFDDGPSEHTGRLLDVLKKYNVKATFFVTGKGDNNLIRREFEEGHGVGLHSYSHDYALIYQNLDSYFGDLDKVQKRVKKIIGKESFLMRFPGGSSNTVSRNYDGGTRIMSKLVKEVEKRGFSYFDWNVSSGDAGSTTSPSGVYQNVVKNLKQSGNSVVLLHDTKGFSVDAVEDIIKYGQSHGYRFEKLEKTSFSAHHGVNN